MARGWASACQRVPLSPASALTLSANRVTAHGLSHLVRSPQFARLADLTLALNWLQDAADVLAPATPSLCRLDLRCASVGPDVLPALSHALFSHSLVHLDLSYNALTAAMFGAGFELCRLLVVQPTRCPQQSAAFATRLFLEGLKPPSAA